MADEETPEETPDAESEPGEGEDELAAGGRRWLLLGAIGLVVLAAGGGTGYVLLTGEDEAEPAESDDDDKAKA